MAKKKTDQKIKHNVYFKGKVQSLGFSCQFGKRTVGVVSPGRHEFGITKQGEAITVVSGHFLINGKRYDDGDTCDIPPGENIVFEAEDYSAYLCAYNT